MTIRDQLIVRIVEDDIIGEDNILKNVDLIELSSMFVNQYGNEYLYIKALPDSIMRNFRGLADEYNEHAEFLFDCIAGFGKQSIYDRPDTAYHFNHSSKTDYHLSKGFIEWLNMEYRKIKKPLDI